jgi:hypothetical protein
MQQWVSLLSNIRQFYAKQDISMSCFPTKESGLLVLISDLRKLMRTVFDRSFISQLVNDKYMQ